jgi:prolyl-tRNA synthetase
MIRAGAQEVLTPIMQPEDVWRRSGRSDSFGAETLRAKDRRGRDLVFSPTAEEAMVELLRGDGALGWRQLPLILFQIEWKFRDEIRPRFGVMRAREFLMKDAYSFDIAETAARRSYAVMFEAYARTFRRLGLSAIPVRAATGAMGGLESHEFHILARTGESAVAYDQRILSETDPTAGGLF